MKTLKVDDHKRIRIPDVKPRTKFACQNHGDGTITLTEVRAEAKEAFPPGSLAKYVTKERDAEMLALLKGTVQEPVERSVNLTSGATIFPPRGNIQ